MDNHPFSPPPPASSQSPNPPSHPPSPNVEPKLDLIPISTITTTPLYPYSNPSPTPNPPISPPKKTPPLPWTHQETINLIQSYQDKWYSLKKGQLKASQWEEVSLAVAARCGYDFPSKSSTQCRHKIEKLRKRYRAERLKPYPDSWQYFDLMDCMERGPLPISAVRYQTNANTSVVVGPAGASNYNNESDSDEGDVNFAKNKLKSINNIVRGDIGLSGNSYSNRNVNSIRSDGVGESGGRVLRELRTLMDQKRKRYFQNGESDEEEEEEEEDEEELEEGEQEDVKEGVVVGREFAAEINGFAERFMRMENKKIDMMRETERYRMEMEKKRMDMILEAQRKLVDTIGRAFGAHKKVKMSQES